MHVSPIGTTIIMRLRRILTFLLLASFTTTLSFAQRPNRQEPEEKTERPTYAPKKKTHGPRAVGVLEWTAKGARLIPVTIKIDKDFHDAGVYLAQPIPMALETGVVYEVQKSGEPLGDFTLEAAQQTESGAWEGIGAYDSRAAQAKRKEAADKAIAAEADAKATEEKEDRPVLHRPKAASTTPDAKPDSTPPSPKAEPAKPATPELHETVSDMNRPILKRGQPKEEQATALGNHEGMVKKAAPPPPGLTAVQVAVSDEDPGQPHSYKWDWANAEEEQKMRAQAEKLAMAALTDFAVKTNGPKPGKLEDVDFHAFDLNFSNSPDMILTARVLPETKPPAKRGAKAAEPVSAVNGLEYYVTIVGREDIYATLQKSFAIATDNKHLDAFPKMHFIDVVDVDGNGTAELLFRSTNDRSNSFVVYRELGYKLDELIRVPEPKD